MRRADRLFQVIQHLRGGRLVTAAQLAEQLEVSERTIYRDIADLQSTGVPIEGEAGVGYVLRSGFDIPPLMFTRDEVTALVAGARMVRSWGGASIARAAEEALVKIETVLPEEVRGRVAATSIFAPPMDMGADAKARFDVIQIAIDDRSVLSFNYRDENGQATSRDVQPLGLWFWGKVWTLLAWCELRDDFRMFRIDRIAELQTGGEQFKPSPERSLTQCLRQLEAKYGPQS